MTPKFCNYLPTAAIIAVGGMNVVSAANPLPAWYGEPGSTRTDYIFDNASLTPVPSLTENPFGSPAATVTLGQFAAGWQRPNTYDLSGVDNDGAWDLGKAGSISVTVPFAQTVPLAGMNFSVDFQVYSVDYRGITALPTLSTPGLTAMDLVRTENTVAADPFFPGATWEGVKWTGCFDNVMTNKVGFTLNAPSNNTSVVDTYEIFTRYTWHSTDPLARIWDGRDVNGNLWTGKDNWGGIAPVAGDTLYFAGGLRLTPDNNLSAGTSIGGITFLSDAGAFTVGGNSIKLDGNVTNTSNQLQTIELPVVLTGERTFTTNGATGGITAGGVISGATGGIVKTGAGTLTLTSANSYGGNTTVAVGTLALAGAGSIASSPVVAVAPGAILDVSGVTSGPWTVGSGQTLTGGGGVVGNTRIGTNATYAPGSGIGSAGVNGNLSFASGSIFEWQMNDSLGSEGSRGVNYDAVNLSGTLSGTDAVFRIILAGTDNFDQPFWENSRQWSNIFSRDGSAAEFDSIFSAFAFANAEGDLAMPSGAGHGRFLISGSSLVWTTLPEPGNAVIGLLLAGGLLRRQRCCIPRSQKLASL